MVAQEESARSSAKQRAIRGNPFLLINHLFEGWDHRVSLFSLKSRVFIFYDGIGKSKAS